MLSKQLIFFYSMHIKLLFVDRKINESSLIFAIDIKNKNVIFFTNIHINMNVWKRINKTHEEDFQEFEDFKCQNRKKFI